MEAKTKAQLMTNLRCRIDVSLAVRVRSWYGQRARLEWPLFREMAKPLRKIEAVEIFLLLEVVAGVVGRHPVRDRIDVQMHFLGALRLANQHLARWNKAVDQVQFGVVQMKCLPVNVTVHIRVGEEDLCGATLGHYRQHPRFLKFFDGLRRQDHRRFVLAPCFLRLHHIIADRLVLDEEPCFVEQEELGCAELLGVSDLIRCPVQNIKQQWFQDFRRIVPAVEIERLKAFERKRVLSVVKQKSVLSTTRPAVEAFFQLANDVAKVRDCALVRFQYVNTLDRVPQSSFLFEVEPVTLLVTLNEYAEKAEEKLQVLFGLRQREGVDGEVPRFLTHIEIRALEYRRKRLEAAADIEDEGQRLVLLRVLQQKDAQIRLATTAHPENQGVGNIAGMQVEIVWRAVVGFEHSQVLCAEMSVRLLAGEDRKQKRQIGVIRVKQIQLAKVQRIVAGHGGEVCVELVVGFRKQIAIRVGEEASELGPELLQVDFRTAVQHNRQREVAQRLAVTQGAQAVAKILNVGLFGFVHQHITRVRIRGIVAHLGDKPGLRHIEVAAALVHFFASFVRRQRSPLCDHIEVGRDLQERIERQGPCFGDGLFHRQHTDDVIAYPQMIAFRFDVGVDHLI